MFDELRPRPDVRFTLNPCFSLLDFPVRREHWTEVNMTWMLSLPQQHTAVSTTCWPADVLRCNSRPIFIHKKGNAWQPRCTWRRRHTVWAVALCKPAASARRLLQGWTVLGYVVVYLPELHVHICMSLSFTEHLCAPKNCTSVWPGVCVHIISCHL